MPKCGISAAALILGLLCIGCGEGGSNSPNPNDPNPGLPTIRGGERLNWDQQASSVTELRSYTYGLYVDGVRASLSDARCTETAASNGYPCSGRLPSMTPGRHTLELSAVSGGGAESSRSAPLTVMVASGSSVSQTGDGAALQSTPGAVPIACIDEQRRECFDVHVLANDLGTVTNVTPIPDGRVLFVEDHRQVRVIADGRIVDEPALVLEDSARIAGMAVEPDFERTHTVYVASAAVGPDEDDATVTRYREVQNTLGDGAVIAAGLPVPKDAEVPITVDSARRVYVALPAFAENRGQSRLAYNGFVLRFTRDGNAAGVDSTSPVLTRAYGRPEALAYDAAERRLWMTGTSAPWDAPLANVGVEREDVLDMAGVAVPARASSDENPSQMVGMAVLPDAAPSRTRRLWILRSAAAPLRGILGARGRVLEWHTTELDLPGQLVAVAQTSRGLIAVVTSTPGKIEKPFTVLQLVAR